MAGSLHSLEAGILSQLCQLMLQGGQQLTPDWLLQDAEHAQRKVTEGAAAFNCSRLTDHHRICAAS